MGRQAAPAPPECPRVSSAGAGPDRPLIAEFTPDRRDTDAEACRYLANTRRAATKAAIEAIDEQDAFFQRDADAMVIAHVTGEEFGSPATPRRTRIQNFRSWYDRALVESGKAVTHEQTGLKIKFDGGGRRKISRLPNDMIHVVPAIPEIVRKGRYTGSEPDRKGRPNIKAWHYFVGTVEVAGRPVTVRLSIREMDNGKFMYSLDRQVDRGGGWTESRANPERDAAAFRTQTSPEGNATALSRSAAPAGGTMPPPVSDDNNQVRHDPLSQGMRVCATARFAEQQGRAEPRIQGIGRSIFGKGFNVRVADSITLPDGPGLSGEASAGEGRDVSQPGMER